MTTRSDIHLLISIVIVLIIFHERLQHALACNMSCSNATVQVIYYAFIYCIDVMKMYTHFRKHITTAVIELKGIRHHKDYCQAPLTTMETSARMLCVVHTCHTE